MDAFWTGTTNTHPQLQMQIKYVAKAKKLLQIYCQILKSNKQTLKSNNNHTLDIKSYRHNIINYIEQNHTPEPGSHNQIYTTPTNRVV